MSRFQLIPFPGEATDGLAIHGEVAITQEGLAINYVVEGALDGLVIPGPAARPERRDNLWQATCLEFFLAREGQPGYLEGNLSPSGHWNLYAFCGYRAGMRREEKVRSLTVHCHRHDRQLRLSTTVPLPEGGEAGTLRLGIAAILMGQDGLVSHWALAHPAPKPDFHTSAAFLLGLAQ
ncbi:MAG: DOMON-like domain-containing protein [Thermodesulfobacteriota bacterium]